MKKREVFLAAVRTEFRLTIVDTAPKLVILLAIAAISFGLVSGLEFVQKRMRSAEALKLSSMEKFRFQQSKAQAIAEGKMAIPDKPYRDPGNTIYVGSGSSGLAELPQPPTSFLSVGESDLYPAAIPVSARGKETFLFNDEISNPTSLLTGVFDIAFVIAILLPLFILALTYNIISGEREQGTLSLNAVSPVPLRVIMSAKLLVRTLIPLFTITVLLIGFAFFIKPESVMLMSVLAAVIILYGLFWGVLALAINGLGFDSTGNAIVMSVLWIISVFIVPALIDATVELFYPALPRTAMVLEVRNATTNTDSIRDAAQAQFELDHAGTSFGSKTAEIGEHSHDGAAALLQEQNILRLRTTKITQLVGDSMYTVQQRRIRQREAFADKLKFLSPVLIIQDIAAEIAGNGSVRFNSYIDQVDQFHTTWRNFFISRAEKNMRLDSAEYCKFPHFTFSESAKTDSGNRIAVDILAIILFLLVAAGMVKVFANRYSIVGR
jgi:ABC-2 type transport system permease protein